MNQNIPEQYPPCKFAISLLFLALLTFLIQTASAQVLLSDSWQVGTPNSQNVNQNLAARQTGTQALAPYNTYGGQHQVDNTGTDVGQPGEPGNGQYLLLAFDSAVQSSLDVATGATGPLVIDFDMYFHSSGNPNHDNTSDWGAFTLQPNTDPFPVVGGANQFGFLSRYSGGIQVFQNGSSLSSVSSWDTPGFAMADHWKLIFTDTAGTGSAFVGNGSKVTMINGGTVAGGGTTLGTITLSQLSNFQLYPGFRDTGTMFIGIANLSIQVTPATVTSNLSFEQNVAPVGSAASVVPAGWLPFNKQGGQDFGSEQAGGTDYSVYDPLNSTAAGKQFLFLNMFSGTGTGGIYQDVGPLQPNMTYTLTVAIGSRADRINSPGIISLVNGTNNTGTVLATTTGLPATQDTWQDYTVTYTTGPSVSGDLTIMLSVAGASTIQANFDNVRLNAPNNTPPPIPLRVQNILPTYAETVVGDQVVFTAAYSNSPPANLQWVQIVSGPVTNDINTGVVNVTNNGVVTSTLTLNDVQLASSGSYQLLAFNATNGAGFSYTLTAPLLVSTPPAPVNNVIVDYASQSFPGSSTNFLPAWPVDTNGDLIYGFTVGSGQGTFASVGDFSAGNNANADPTLLSDGIIASMTAVPNEAFCAGGLLDQGVGSSVTYTLITNSAPFGLDLTNITVFGGWQDGGRDEQKYQILYSTVQSPGTLVPLVTADYLPANPNNQPTVSRTMLVPATGVLVHNVAVVEINFNVSPSPENSWEGYSEVVVGGQPSTGFVPSLTGDVTPSTASDVVGSQLVLTANFSGATSLQWQKNGTNITGATNSTILTLNNLQLTDAGSYALVATNSVGGNSSHSCSVVVYPTPTAVSNIVTSIATQTSVAQIFTPTWDASQLASSLIYNTSPSSSGEGDFDGGIFGTLPAVPTYGSQPTILTDGSFGTIDFDVTGQHLFVTCMGVGDGTDPANTNKVRGGQYVVYTLPASANGYTITNIITAGGWNDNGRDQQAYTIDYATAANPTYFTPLTMVFYSPTNPVGYSVTRATLTGANGVLVSNVVALEFDMTTPNGENGYEGYSEIAVYGSPSATAQPVGPVITVEHEETNNTFVLETPNLIALQLPSSYGPGVFTDEGCNETNLTSGILGFGAAFSASCGDDGTAVPWIIFTSETGWNLTDIVTYTLWHDYGRDGQFYNLSYSTLSAPATFLPLASVAYNPAVPENGTASGNRIAIAPATGQSLLASNVYAVKFDFTPQGTQDFGWSGYTQIVLQGANLVAYPPIVSAPVVSGTNLVVTGTGGSANVQYTWLTTTNLTTPLTNWTVLTTGRLSGSGGFSNSFPISPSQPAQFFQLRVP